MTLSTFQGLGAGFVDGLSPLGRCKKKKKCCSILLGHSCPAKTRCYFRTRAVDSSKVAAFHKCSCYCRRGAEQP